MPRAWGKAPRGEGGHARRALYRTSAWQQVARQVVQAADVCALCGQPPTLTDRLEADHIVPLALGGAALDRDNLRAAHKSCNARRGQRLGAELRARRAKGGLGGSKLQRGPRARSHRRW